MSENPALSPEQDMLQKLQKDLLRHVALVQKALEDKEEWLDQEESNLDDAGHEAATRVLDRYESLLECLEEALEILEDEG